jgi:hypothetical protein
VDTGSVLCPSSRCEPGAILLGLHLPNGTVMYATEPFVVDEKFVAAANDGRAPEKRFRFSSPCMKGACRQWTGSRCGVIDDVLVYAEVSESELPACSIRERCRWFIQSGREACGVCPLVMTDSRENAVSENHSSTA